MELLLSIEIVEHDVCLRDAIGMLLGANVAKFKRIDDTMGTKMSSRFIATENTLQCSSINLGYRTTRAKFLKAMGATSFNVTAYMNDIFRISTIKEERGLNYPFQRSFSLSFGIGF